MLKSVMNMTTGSFQLVEMTPAEIAAFEASRSDSIEQPLVETPTSITMKDTVTGAPVMFEVQNGAFKKSQE